MKRKAETDDAPQGENEELVTARTFLCSTEPALDPSGVLMEETRQHLDGMIALQLES